MNVERARAQLELWGLDAIVATSPVNVGYLSGWWCWLDGLVKDWMFAPGASSARTFPTFAVVTRAGGVALVVPAGLAANAVDLGVRELHVYGPGPSAAAPPAGLDESEAQLADRLARSRHASAAAALAHLLRDVGAQEVGIEREGLRPQDAAALGGTRMRDCTRAIELLRTVKSPDEVAALRRATEVSESALAGALGAAAGGVAVGELAQAFRERVATEGAAFDHFAFGVRGLGIATEPTRRRLRSGEVLYVDAGCAVEHRIADIGLTLAVDAPPDRLAEGYAALRDSVAAGAEALVPGAPASRAWEAMQALLEDRGWDATAQGHGVGLEVREHPIVAPAGDGVIADECVEVPADLALETGMVVNLEVTSWLPGAASLHVERSFLVTAGAAEPLARQEREAPVMAVSR